jgi:Catalase
MIRPSKPPSLLPAIVVLLIGVMIPACRGTAAQPADRQSALSGDLETIPGGENEAIQKITDAIKQVVQKQFEAEPPARRDVHAKAHGCVKAEFRVLDDNEKGDNDRLAEDLHIGVFKKSSVFPACIRFSNGSPKIQKDSKGDARGMAVKLMRVPGAKVLEHDEQATQDFVLISHPVFFVRNADDYVDLSENVLKFFVPVFHWPPVRWHELQIALAIARKKVTNPLETRYWSMVPSRLGTAHAVKYSATPCDGENDSEPTGDEPADYLRRSMAEFLAKRDGCFYFMVQVRTDPATMPVEDPTVEWNERLAPFKKVARITIPRGQEFDAAEATDFCENLSLTPWHSLEEHRPLGGIQRVRKTVYTEISILRHQLNGKSRQEPQL